MRPRWIIRFPTAVVGLLLLATVCSLAQNKRETMRGNVWHPGEEWPIVRRLTITIDSQSSAEDQQILVEAFEKGGNKASVKALEKMPTRGHIYIRGLSGKGYAVSYLKVWPTAKGRDIRLITSRKIPLEGGRSPDYTVSAVELHMSSDRTGRFSKGQLYLACQLGVSKEEKEIEINPLQEPMSIGFMIDWRE